MRTRSLTLIMGIVALLLLAACDAAQMPTGAGQGATATPPVSSSTSRASAPAAAPTVLPQKSSAAATALPLPTIVFQTALPPAMRSTATPVPQPTAASLPAPTPEQKTAETLESLRGKILFRTDRSGGYIQLYVMNSDGTGQRPCDCSDVLEAMVKREVASPDGQMFLYVKNVGGSLRAPADQQIWSHNNRNAYEALVTGEAPGFPGMDYAPVWSPDSRRIAWVSTSDGNDEIYLHDMRANENTRLTDNDKAWDKHPSFSPDGSQIVFWSNRESAVRKQIWLMNLDGSQSRNISQNTYNDYDPIWVK